MRRWFNRHSGFAPESPRTLLTLLLLLVLAFGCQRRPLEMIATKTVRVIINCVWVADAYPEGMKPTGVTYYLFRNGTFFNSYTTANVDEYEVHLEEGKYQIYVIGQSPEEYWRMTFDNMNVYDDASTTLVANQSTWAAALASRAGEPEVVTENPEILCAGVADEFEITSDMTEEYQRYYTALTKLQTLAVSGDGTKADGDAAYYEEMVEYYTIRIPVYISNVVSQFKTTIYAGNADVLQSVRATTSGMARTFAITRNTTTHTLAVQMITDWSLTMDDEAARVGHVDGIITTFGLPDGDKPSATRDASLNVSTLLVDNSTVLDYTFEVGNLIREEKPTPGYRDMYHLILGSVDEPAIILPDVNPQGGGFVANVTDWGEEVNADIPI